MVDTPMPLTSHLAELRGCLFICVIAIAIGFAVYYALSDHITTALQSPPNLLGPSLTVSLQIIAPAEAFLTYLKVSFRAVCFSPCRDSRSALVFCRDGLLEHEKKYTVPFIVRISEYPPVSSTGSCTRRVDNFSADLHATVLYA